MQMLRYSFFVSYPIRVGLHAQATKSRSNKGRLGSVYATRTSGGRPARQRPGRRQAVAERQLPCQSRRRTPHAAAHAGRRPAGRPNCAHCCQCLHPADRGLDRSAVPPLCPWIHPPTKRKRGMTRGLMKSKSYRRGRRTSMQRRAVTNSAR